MSITFNADEIIEMAEEIERNGAKFYREAAKNASAKKTKHMLLDMSAMTYSYYRDLKQGRLSQGDATFPNKRSGEI